MDGARRTLTSLYNLCPRPVVSPRDSRNGPAGSLPSAEATGGKEGLDMLKRSLPKRSLAVGTAASAAAFAVAALGAVPAMAAPGAAPARSTTPMCVTSQLSARLGSGDAGAGNLYRYLVITNHGGTTCHVTGYPGLSLVDAHGRQIGAPADRDRRSYEPVVLRPGASASDTIHTANRMGTCLPASTSLRIYPPGNRASLVFPGKVTICDRLFTVTPFTAGAEGNPSNAGAGGGPSPVPSTSSGPTARPMPATGRQVRAVPSGAPDTGVAPAASSGSHGTEVVAAAAAGGALVLGGLGFAVRRRTTRTQVRG